MTIPLDAGVLGTFVAIPESGGFTRAAARVHRTQSAVSVRTRRLDAALGRPHLARERSSAPEPHMALMPPSITSSEPVTNADSSAAR